MTGAEGYAVRVYPSRRSHRAERWCFQVGRPNRADLFYDSGYRYHSEAAARAAGVAYVRRLAQPTHLVDPDATQLG